MASRAKQLVDALEGQTRARQETWTEGDHPNLVEVQTYKLAGLHQEKRVMRREVYDAAPSLEGRPFYKGRPEGQS